MRQTFLTIKWIKRRKSRQERTKRCKTGNQDRKESVGNKWNNNYNQNGFVIRIF